MSVGRYFVGLVQWTDVVRIAKMLGSADQEDGCPVFESFQNEPPKQKKFKPTTCRLSDDITVFCENSIGSIAYTQ